MPVIGFSWLLGKWREGKLTGGTVGIAGGGLGVAVGRDGEGEEGATDDLWV